MSAETESEPMTDKRIPKPGEVWLDFGDDAYTVVNVYPDAVTYKYGESGELFASTLDTFLQCSTPPEPTVVDKRYLTAENNVMAALYRRLPCCTHRLDLMSDGEFRVVKL